MLSVCVHLGLGALVQPPSLAPHASRSATYARSAPFASAADDVDRRGFVAQSTAAAVGTAALAHASPARADFFGGDEKPQWKQLGNDSTQLRLQVKFVRKVDGPKTTFAIGDVRATAPQCAAPLENKAES